MALHGADRTHQITSNGTFELPFGTGHYLLGNAPGWVQQIVNKWQLGGILNYKIALVASTLRTLALIWAAVATVACIKMLHGFSWRRAIVAFLISFTIILLLTILVLFIVNIAHLIRGD